MRIDGSCHCGRIRFEAEVDPGKVLICHCTDCQTLSGSAFRVVVASEPGSFRLLAGTPRIYAKTAASGNVRDLAFCGDCGTPIYSGPPDAPAASRVLGLRVGAIRQRDLLVPRDQYWFRSSRPWLADLQALSHWDTQPAFGADGSFANTSGESLPASKNEL